MLKITEKKGGVPLPDDFKNKTFRSYVDAANFADEHGLPDGEYWIRNDKGTNIFTAIRELKRCGSSFWVEGRGNV